MVFFYNNKKPKLISNGGKKCNSQSMEDAITAPPHNLNFIAAIRRITDSLIKSLVRIRPEIQGKIRTTQLNFNPVKTVYKIIR